MLFPIKRAEVQRSGGEQRAYREYDQRDHAAAQSQLGVGQQIVDVPQAHPEKLRDRRGVKRPQQQGEQPEHKDGKIGEPVSCQPQQTFPREERVCTLPYAGRFRHGRLLFLRQGIITC